MNLLSIPPQLVRLIILTILIVGSYLTARQFMVPESFGEYGWYRGEALRSESSHEPNFPDKQSCLECHEEQESVHALNEHNTISCVSCHGAIRDHVENEEVKVATHDDNLCLRCHDERAGRPEFVYQIDLEDHYQEDREACVECHMPHQPNEMPEE